jgi:serine/threonine protein kinase
VILVGIAGPYLTVTGAIFSDRLTTQRLTDYVYLGPHLNRNGRSGRDEGIHQVARVLRALEASTNLLRDFYLGLDLKAERVDGELMPPYFREFTSDGKLYKLKYTKRMAEDYPDKAVFEASTKPVGQVGEPEGVVVKFTHSYCGAAHRLLAEQLLAPRLRYCEKVESIGMYVVIMDLVGRDISASFRDQQRVANKLRTAIKTLHGSGLVHGDLREPNILVTEDGDVKIIDFDWSGKEGEAYYPSDINLGSGIWWDSEVARGGLIKKKHDRTMYQNLTGLEWSEEEKTTVANL